MNNATINSAAISSVIMEIYTIFLVREAKALGIRATVTDTPASLEARIGSAEYARHGTGAHTRARLADEYSRIRLEVIRFLSR